MPCTPNHGFATGKHVVRRQMQVVEPSGGRSSSRADGRAALPDNGAEADDAKKVKIRGYKVSEPIMQLWGERCRIIEWTVPEGGSSRLAVPVTATAEEIRRQVKRYRLGERHLAADDWQGAGPMTSPALAA